MKVKNSSMQAFPFIEPNDDDAIKAYHPGISLRDYFAAKAMQAAATNPTGADGFTFEQRAEWAYAQADAMLKAREA